MILRPYQTDLIEAVRAALREKKKAPLLVSPTGSGKTVMFCHIADGAGKKGKRVWILVHRQELVDQTTKTMRAFGVDHGVIAAGWAINPLPHVQVVSVQTVARRLDKQLPPDIIIVDECHHAAAGTWAKIIDQFKKAIVIGFTATPERLDGKGLASAFDLIIRGPEVEWLIKNGFLTRPKYFSPPNNLNLDDVHIVAGDYQKNELEAARLCKGVPAIAFCTSVKHAQHVAEAFIAAGYSAATLDGSLDRATRRQLVADLSAGKLQVLTSCEIVSEGFDIPSVVAAILLRPTKSLSMHLQQIGRVLRPAPNKPFAYILDHVGNCLRHGLAEQVREWSLQGRKKRKKNAVEIVDVKQCPKCFACHEPAPSCPECGHIYVAKKRSGIESVEGDLVELETTWGRPPNADEIKRDIAFLVEIAKAREYEPGWIDAVMASRVDNNITAPMDPGGTIEDWKGITRPMSKEEFKQQKSAAKTYDDLVALARSRGYAKPHFWARQIWQSRNSKGNKQIEKKAS
jgi:superfamily II DNA or RNA helicase